MALLTLRFVLLARRRVALAMVLVIMAMVESLVPAQAESVVQPDGSVSDGATVNYLVLEQRAEPFQIVENGESKGGTVTDIVSAIFSMSPWTVKTWVMPINRLRKSVSDGDVHYWVAYDAMRWRTFGNNGLMVDEALFDTHHTLLTCRTDLPDNIQHIGQLRDLKLATIRDFSYPEIEQAARKGLLQQIPVDRYDAGIRLVRMGRVDGFVEIASRLQYHMRSAENAGCFRWVDVSDVIPDFPIYLAVSAEWPREFRSFIADCIRELKATGKIDAILARYRQMSPKRTDQVMGTGVSPN